MRVHVADYGSDPANWMASNVGGTPGAANVVMDPLPPTVPANLAARATVGPSEITLTWTASTDTRSNVDHYVIYRSGTSIGTSTSTSYADTTAQAATNYTYTVSAVNRDGCASAQSGAIVADLPGVSSDDWLDSQHMEINFSEPLDPTTALVLGNYGMNGGITFSAVALSRSNTKVTLTTTQAVSTGNVYTLTISGLTTASGNQLPASLTVSTTYQAPTGRILDEVWDGLDGGTAISDLTSPALNPNFPNNPTYTQYLTSFEAPCNTGVSDYGEVIQGYLYPPTTGLYTFWIASDDNSQLWLSTTASPSNAVQIAYVSSWTNYEVWNSESSQQSASISLVAGQHYYIEALMKQGGGGDNLSVGWMPPGGTSIVVIPGACLSPLGGNMDLNLPATPANLRATVTGSNNQITLNWSPVADLTGGIAYYQIYRDGAAYATSTTATYTDSSNISSLTPHTYQVSAVNYDGVAGAESAALTVGPPGIASISTADANTVWVTFSEPVSAASAQTIGNYSITTGGIGIAISAAVLQSNGCTVALTTTATLVASNSYTLTAGNIATPPGPLLPATSGTFTYGPVGWNVTVYKGKIDMGSDSIALAQTVVNTPSDQSWVKTEVAPYINYNVTGGNNHFTGSYRTLPGTTMGTETDNFAVTATGTLVVPAAGTYTFGVSSDNGFSLTISGATFSSWTNATNTTGASLQFDGGRGVGDTLGVVAFAAAGNYPVSLLWFQGGGGAACQLFAAQGSYTAFTTSPPWELVGDVTDGGLAMGGSIPAAWRTAAVTPLTTNDPTPALSGTVSASTAAVTARVAGVYYATTNNNGVWTLPEGDIQPPLTAGTYDVALFASSGSGQTAFDSTVNELQIASAAPVAILPLPSPNQRNTPLNSLSIQFTEPVSGLGLQDFAAHARRNKRPAGRGNPHQQRQSILDAGEPRRPDGRRGQLHADRHCRWLGNYRSIRQSADGQCQYLLGHRHHAADNCDQHSLAFDNGRRARQLHGNLCRRELRFQHPGRGQRFP